VAVAVALRATEDRNTPLALYVVISAVWRSSSGTTEDRNSSRVVRCSVWL